MVAHASLSSGLSSVYRLFLRAIAGAVLHHSSATRNLRKLYRPVFAKAARVEAQIATTHDPGTRKVLSKWLVDWNQRVDNTLELLHCSATSRGLSHRLTRNMGYLTDAYLKSRRSRPSRAWDPQLPSTSPLYSVPTKSSPTEKERKRAGRERLAATALGAMGQVVGLAEGRSGIFLGRLSPASGSRRHPSDRN